MATQTSCSHPTRWLLRTEEASSLCRQGLDANLQAKSKHRRPCFTHAESETHTEQTVTYDQRAGQWQGQNSTPTLHDPQSMLFVTLLTFASTKLACSVPSLFASMPGSVGGVPLPGYPCQWGTGAGGCPLQPPFLWGRI